MGRGIQGYIYSLKNNKKFFFRSLLELYYLIKIEEDNSIKEYEVEPFQIPLDNIHHYTPDVLINNEQIIELKPHNFLTYCDSKERFEKEQQIAHQYAKENNMTYKVIYDTDIGFETKAFKKYLQTNVDIIEKYQISFMKNWS